MFGILLMHNHFNIDRQEKQIKFDHALIAFMVYFLADSFWAAHTARIIPRSRPAVVINVFLIYVFMAAITYCWLGFVMAFEQAPHRNRPINRFAVLFPFLVSTIVLILHYLIAPQALMDEELNTLPVYTIYLITVPSIYLFAVLFYTVGKARKEENPAEKRKHLFIGFLPLIILTGGLIQEIFLPHVPIYCFLCLILMLIFYIQSIEAQVSLDPLTSLNNRGQLARYTSQKANLTPGDRHIIVVMMDIDNFKSINDTFGHAEGDRALVIIADSLKKVINSHSAPSFLGRYGGDEFIMIIHAESKDEVDRIIAEIRAEVSSHETSYPLSVSAGYDELMGEQDSIQSCIQKALPGQGIPQAPRSRRGSPVTARFQRRSFLSRACRTQ